MSNIWFTSDTHFGHENIIKYCERPFKDYKEMDETIIKNWNERVADEDVVYFLGDFCFKKSKEAPTGNVFEYYRKQLKGDIIFIQGNHDRNNSTKTPIQSILIKYGGNKILLIHNIDGVTKFYPLILCGHVHEKWQFKKLHAGSIVCNVGGDVWGFKPISINEILSEKAQWLKLKENK